MAPVKNSPLQCKRKEKLSKKMASFSESHKAAPLHTVSKKKSQKKISKRVSKSVPQQRNSKAASSRDRKITKKDQNLHRMLFEENGLPNRTEVAYYSHGKKIEEGYITETGICCGHCNKDISPSQFEVHAGWASRRKPYSHIYLSNMVSLHEFALCLLLERGKSSVRDNDPLCNICAVGGNLLFCDGCPRSFHQDCASLPTVPDGKWYCKFCQNTFRKLCKANVIAAARVPVVDMKQKNKHCTRVVKEPKASKDTECVLCRRSDYLPSDSGFGPRTIIFCDQCDKEYHIKCLRKHNMADLQDLPVGEWFCCSECSGINSSLQNLLVSEGEKLSDSLLDITRRKHNEKGLEGDANMDVRFRLLGCKISSDENRLLLGEAYTIFHERFDTIIDYASGYDYIPSMVYGRKIGEHKDFSRMYCAILTVNSTVVSAGLLRVFGRDIAELPLIATSTENQGKGYLQLLYSRIENLLTSLEVRNFVLPASKEAESMWVHRFGFQRISKEKFKDYKRTCWSLQTFGGSAMLEKAVPRNTCQDSEKAVPRNTCQDSSGSIEQCT